MAVPALYYLGEPLAIEDGTPYTPTELASYAALLNIRGFLSLCEFGYDVCKLGLRCVGYGFYHQAIHPIGAVFRSIFLW